MSICTEPEQEGGRRRKNNMHVGRKGRRKTLLYPPPSGLTEESKSSVFVTLPQPHREEPVFGHPALPPLPALLRELVPFSLSFLGDSCAVWY